MTLVTKIEVNRAGERVRVYHHKRGTRTEGQGVTQAWTHPYDQRGCVPDKDHCTRDNDQTRR